MSYFTTDDGEPRVGRMISVAALVLVGLIIILGSFAVVSPGERGLVLRVGSINRVLDSGLHFKMPLIERVVKLDVQTQKEQVKTQAASSDLQNVETVVALNYNLQPDRVQQLYTSIGEDYSARVIDPAIQEAVKASTANYTAEQLITKRQNVTDDIKKSLSDRLSPSFINVTQVSIVNFDFSAQFNAAIEAKVTAEQNALAAKNKLDQVKFEAEQRIATAGAEAQAIRLQSDAANNEKYVALKRVEVQLKLAERWNGQLPQNMYGSAPLPLLDITK